MTEQELSKLEQSVIKQLRDSGLNAPEVKRLLKQAGAPSKAVSFHRGKFSEQKITLGLFGDSHIGHKNFREDVWAKAAAYWAERGVDAIYHTGDVIEGMSNRDGHVYELDQIGVSAQIQRAATLCDMMPAKVYGITGNHENWAMRKANQGLIVGEVLDDKCDNFEYLGMDIADIELWKGINMRLQHPGDGTAYAISYKPQKIVNGMPPDNRPAILAVGHYHKSEYLNYDNIHCFQTGTLCDQTPFMFSKGIPAHVGFWTLEIFKKNRKPEIERINMEWMPG